jgi:RNA polymerase sigma-70 factor (ECF subfamily)
MTADERFVTTHWSVVIQATMPQSQGARKALTELCETYWYPLYAFCRRRGYSREQAEDLTQHFFAHLIERNSMSVAEPSRGRFRAFLLTSLKNFLANQWRAETTKRRGEGRVLQSLDFKDAAARYATEPAHDETPEAVFERRWAMTIVQNAMNRLTEEQTKAGKAKLSKCLKTHLGGQDGRVPYAMLAAELGMSEGAVRVALHRLRLRFRELIRSEIAATVANEAEIDEELKVLFAALAR